MAGETHWSKLMQLGPNPDLVLEIVDLVESGVIFRNPQPPLSEVKIIHNMANVLDYLHVIANYEDDEGYDWRDLLLNAGEPDNDLITEREIRRSAMPGLTDSINELVDERIHGALRRQLGTRYTEDDILYIRGTIDFILCFRATFGRTLPFIERLVDIYRLGGHPCGWVGRYPEGEMVAYFPPGDDERRQRAGSPGEIEA
jgi:hypothetical protein